MQELNVLSAGSPRVDAQSIEEQLRQLWEQSARAEEGEAVVRVCVLNLLIYVPDEGRADSDHLNEVIAEVSHDHPGRTIVMLAQPDVSAPRLTGRVTALCHLAQGRKQVCSEQVIIEAGGEAVSDLPSVIRSILIRDLPVILWWRTVPAVNSAIFSDLAEECERVIIDSSTLPRAEAGIRELAAVVQRRKQWIHFSDLNWARLTPWRLAIAGFFDISELRPYLDRLETIEIDCECTPGESLFIQPLLIASWMASRLGWEPVSALSENGADCLALDLKAGPRDIQLRISRCREGHDGTPGELRAVRLGERGEHPAYFSVCSAEDAVHLKTWIELDGKVQAGKIIPLLARNEASLLSQELEILGHDEAYEEALGWFIRVPGG
jgi:glucose-6-phosphate dehydrogenase assembly protein OpcA